MKENCKGLCVFRSDNGEVHTVRVMYAGAGGIEMDVTREKYESRGYQPAIDELPSFEEYYANKGPSSD